MFAATNYRRINIETLYQCLTDQIKKPRGPYLVHGPALDHI